MPPSLQTLPSPSKSAAVLAPAPWLNSPETLSATNDAKLEMLAHEIVALDPVLTRLLVEFGRRDCAL
jgi:hypothetical protein